MRRLFLIAGALLLLQLAVASPESETDPTVHEGKVVLVDFWASWCVPCRRSFPWLNAMHDKYAEQGLVIVGVNEDEKRDSAAEFLAKYPPQFTIVYDETKSLASRFKVVALPSSYVIGRDGEIVQRHFGFKVKKQHEYEAAIVEALGKSQ